MIKNGLWFLLLLITLNLAAVLGYWPAIIVSFVVQLGLMAFIWFAVIMAGIHCLMLRCWK